MRRLDLGHWIARRRSSKSAVRVAGPHARRPRELANLPRQRAGGTHESCPVYGTELIAHRDRVLTHRWNSDHDWRTTSGPVDSGTITIVRRAGSNLRHSAQPPGASGVSPLHAS